MAAAVEVFAEAGYAGAAMSQIAARADVVPSVIYDHFPSKRELYMAVMEARGAVAVERTTRQVSGETPRELLDSVLEALFSQVEQDRFFWRSLLRDPPPDAEIAALHQGIRASATEGLATLIGAFAPDARSMFGVPRDRLT